MGQGIATTPPQTGDAFALLLDAMRDMTAELKENNRLRRKENNPWLTDVEAATILGINVKQDAEGNPTTYHTRLLKQLRDMGYLTNYTGERSIKYDRKEVLALIEKERNDAGFFLPRRILR